MVWFRRRILILGRVCRGREGKQVEEGIEEEREYVSILDFGNIFAREPTLYETLVEQA
jgi:hypothetical protein